MKINIDEVWENVEEGWLRYQTWEDKLYVFNYSHKTEFERRWTPLARTLRGAVLDADGNWVGRAIPKFFALGATEETKWDNLPKEQSYEITGKLDGSILNLHWNPISKSWQFTSKCSFTSDYVKAAERFIPPAPEDLKHLTFLLELRFTGDAFRRVTDLEDGLYLITAYETETGREITCLDTLNLYAKRLGAMRVPVIDTTLENAYASYLSLEGTEGYVIRFSDGFRVKFKTPWYNVRNRLLNDINTPEEARENIRTYLENYENNIDLLMENIPEEYKDEVLQYVIQVQEGQAARRDLVDMTFNNVYSENKKEFALAIQDKEKWLKAALFRKYAGEDYSKFLIC